MHHASRITGATFFEIAVYNVTMYIHFTRYTMLVYSHYGTGTGAMQPWLQGLEKFVLCMYFAPPHPCAMLKKHFHLQ